MADETHAHHLTQREVENMGKRFFELHRQAEESGSPEEMRLSVIVTSPGKIF